MQSRRLHSFLTVAERGSITRAAEILNVSQPALTKSIRQLEEELGVKLFDRTPKGVQLTKFGDILFRHVKVMDNEYRHAISRINDLRDGRSGALRIGAGPVWMVKLLPPIIAELQARNPDITISLIGGVIDTLVPNLIDGDLDLICVSLDFPNRSEIVKKPLLNTRHVLVAAPDHPLVREKDVDAAQIHGFPWMVLRSDYVGNERISSFFAAHGLKPPKIALETTSIQGLLQGLRDGNHIAHIPFELMSLAEQMGLKSIHSRQTIWETSAGYAYRASARLPPQVKALMRLLDASAMEATLAPE